MQIVRSIKESEILLCPILPPLVEWVAVGELADSVSTIRTCQTTDCMSWIPHPTLVNQGSCALIKIDDTKYQFYQIGKASN